MQLGLYQHYNGGYYQVIGICRHSETLEEMVVYRHLSDDYGLWVRPKDMFTGTVNKAGQTVPRFHFVRELNTVAPELR